VIMINNNCLTWFVDVNQYGMLLHEFCKPYDQGRHHSFLGSILVIRRFSN